MKTKVYTFFASALLVLASLLFGGTGDYILHSAWSDGRAVAPFQYRSVDSLHIPAADTPNIGIAGTTAGGLIQNSRSLFGNLTNISLTQGPVGTNTNYSTYSTVLGRDNFDSASTYSFISGRQNRGLNATAGHLEGDGNTSNAAYSHVEGLNHVLSGNAIGAHVEGYAHDVRGAYSHVEGKRNIDSVNATDMHIEGADHIVGGTSAYCHVEGGVNSLSGTNNFYSHLEGYGNLGYKAYSHIEGLSNLDSGSINHVEGNANNVGLLASMSHVEGARHVVLDSLSHIEGRDHSDSSTGYGNHLEGSQHTINGVVRFSHVEGELNKVYSVLGHVEGTLNVDTVGSTNHVEGSGNYTKGTVSHIEGVSSIDSGLFSHLEGYTQKVGPSIQGTHVEGGTNQVYTHRLVAGNWNHSEGYGNITRSAYSHVEGSNNTQGGTYSHVEGLGNLNSDSGSLNHIEGQTNYANATLGHVEGYKDTTYGIYSHVEGWLNYNRGAASHTEGYSNFNYSDYSHVEGFGNYSKAPYSHVEGWENRDSGAFGQTANHVEGHGNTIKDSGLSIHVEGYNNIHYRYGQQNHIEGNSNKDSGDGSHVEGLSNIVGTTQFCHIEGSGNRIYSAASPGDNPNIHVEGTQNKGSGTAAHCEGAYSSASGAFSHSQGIANEAAGDYSFASGANDTTHYAQTIVGLFAVNDGNIDYAATAGQNVFKVGWGTSATVKKDIFKVNDTGTITTTGNIKFSTNGFGAVGQTVAANAGIVGEVLSAGHTSGTALSTGASLDLDSIVLTPGAWYLTSRVIFDVTSGTTPTANWKAAQSVSGYPSGIQTNYLTPPVFAFAGKTNIVLTGYSKIVTTNTTVYLRATASWSGGTGVSVFGDINALRVR